MELMLRNNQQGAGEELTTRESSAHEQTRGIENARSTAHDSLSYITEVRRKYGHHLDRELEVHIPPPTAASALRPAVASLVRHRERLRLAEEEFDRWQKAYDERSDRLLLAASCLLGVTSAVVEAVQIGGPLLTSAFLVFVALTTVLIATTAVVVAVVRRSPRVCVGQPLQRVPSLAGMSRFMARTTAVILVGLVVVRVLVISMF
jgi:hypothetical protein